jgi:putative FmdB family regulatory protein
MPIYDFKCRDCGRVSEILVRSTDSREVCCPGCGGVNLERLIPSSFLVKAGSPSSGGTCCGRAERCQTPPCSTGEGCHRR